VSGRLLFSLPAGSFLFAHASSLLFRRPRIAAKFGVTKAITAPSSAFIHGLSFAFSPRAANPLSPNAILQEVTALHLIVGHAYGLDLSISTQIGVLRKLLKGKTKDEGGWWKKVAEGELPVVIETHKADIIARLILLKGKSALYSFLLF